VVNYYKNKQMIRIYVVEDHEAIVVYGLKRMFIPGRDGINITGSSKSVEHAIKNANPCDFDLFSLDLYLDSQSPVKNFKSLKFAFPDKPVMIYTSETAVAWKSKMAEEGVLAYITKDAERYELKAAIQSVSKGIPYFPVDPSMGRGRTEVISKDFGNTLLNPVQQAIINMLVKGHCHKEIADVIGISRSLLEDILMKMRKMFNAKNNIELVSKVNNFF
jgi:DNA-binding NarL/FixJ family response regulator